MTCRHAVRLGSATQLPNANRLQQAAVKLTWAVWAIFIGHAALGCASLPGNPTTASTTAETREYSGRFALTTELNGERNNESGRFVLRVDGPSLALDLATPLGTTLARLEVDQQGARLRAPGNQGSLQQAEGADAEALAEQVLGYALPIDGLSDWIRGRPSSREPAALRITRNDQGQATRIEQAGWQISIQEHFSQLDAPRRLTLTRAARAASNNQAAAPALTLRLVLDAPAATPCLSCSAPSPAASN